MEQGFAVGLIVENARCVMSDIRVAGFAGAQILLSNVKGGTYNRVTVDGRARTKDGRKVGRNEPCPCGSGKKLKKCHGVNHMGKGIVSDNSEGQFTDTLVSVDEGSTGIHLMNGDKSKFLRTQVLVGQDVDIEKLIALLNIPDDVPREYVVEAVNIAKEQKDPLSLRFSRLKTWLLEKGLDVKFAAETMVSLTAAVIGAGGL